MIKNIKSLFAVFICSALIISCNTNNSNIQEEKNMEENVKRIGMVIKIKPEKIQEYKELHSDSHQGVRHLLEKYNMRNFSIYLKQLEDGNYYEFAYYEYTGKDYEADMAALAKEPENIEWLSKCDAMQIPLFDEKSWLVMDEIFYNE